MYHNNKSLIDIENELWLPDVDFGDCYMVSNLGRVKSLSRVIECKNGKSFKIKERILAQASDDKGYLRVSFWKNHIHKKVQVHRRVALAFIPNIENKATVNHKEGNHHDNRVEKLEWATQLENNVHSLKILGVIRNSKAISSYWKGKKRNCPWLKNKRPHTKGINNHKSRQIKCDTLDMSFPSMTEAKAILGISLNSLLVVLKGKKSCTWFNI